MDWPGAVRFQVLLLTLPREEHFLVIIDPLMMVGYPWIPLLQIEPLIGGVGVEGATVAVVTATLMALAPLGEGVRKRMDF